MTKANNEDDLASNIDRKVLYCYNDDAVIPDDEAIDLPHEMSGKPFKCCPHCAERLRRVREDRIPAPATTGEVLGSMLSPYRDSVVRIFNSPWGRVKAHISAQSFFAPFVVKAEGEWRVLYNPNTDRMEQELEPFFAPVPAIKRMIDEGFSGESYFKSLDAAPGEVDLQTYSTFFAHLREIVAAIHRDPNAPVELDLDPVLDPLPVAA